MRRVDVALGLIQQNDRYHLQLRNHKASSGANNLIGCFGGKIEDKETPEQAVCRELSEETSLNPKEEDIELLGTIDVISDYKTEQVNIRGHVFKISLDRDVQIQAIEGELVSITANDIPEVMPRMTVGTEACFKQFVE